MNKETRLKFKLLKLPDSLGVDKNLVPVIIKQIYLVLDDDTIKERINTVTNLKIEWLKISEIIICTMVTTDNKLCCVTLRSENKNEYESVITESEFYELSSMKNYGMIFKFRYKIKIPDTDLVLEIDNYLGSLLGLMTADIEYDTEKYPNQNIITEFTKKYLGDDIVDVTFDKKYINRNLAILNNVVLLGKNKLLTINN